MSAQNGSEDVYFREDSVQAQVGSIPVADRVQVPGRAYESAQTQTRFREHLTSRGVGTHLWSGKG